MSLNNDQTPVTIVNSALIKVGAAPIMSLEEDSKEARVCKEQYFKNKRALILAHPWNFAKDRFILPPVAEEPLWEYQHKFLIPSNVLRILEIKDQDCIEYDIEGKYILANTDKIYLKAITDCNENLFSEYFSELLAYKIAFDISFSLSESTTLRKALEQTFVDKEKLARSYNAQEGGHKDLYYGDGSYVNSRFSGPNY